ncbi:hypothetical protein BT69DRAFT_1287350 [Atractiella rhizophila]|nr:hypothetical protein BT69DRAFT_1287350 [Atractiella rhizophila]
MSMKRPISSSIFICTCVRSQSRDTLYNTNRVSKNGPSSGECLSRLSRCLLEQLLPVYYAIRRSVRRPISRGYGMSSSPFRPASPSPRTEGYSQRA